MSTAAKFVGDLAAWLLAAIFFAIGAVFFMAGLGCFAVAGACGMLFDAVYRAWSAK